VIMATQYDATRPQFTSKSQMENSEFASSCRQSSSMYHPIECARSQDVLQELYIRSGSNPQDPRFTDFGNFALATVGQQASSVNIGELWVTYEIELMKPVMDQAQGSGELYTGHINTPSNVTVSNFFSNTSGIAIITGNLGLSISISANSVKFPPWFGPGQSLFCSIVVTGTGTASVVLPSISVTGMTATASWQNDSISGPTNVGVSSVLFVNYIFNVTATSPTLTIGAGTGTFPTGTVSSDIYFTSILPLITFPDKLVKEIHPDKFTSFDDMKKMISRLQSRVHELEGLPDADSDEECSEVLTEETLDLQKEKSSSLGDKIEKIQLMEEQLKEYRMISEKLREQQKK